MRRIKNRHLGPAQLFVISFLVAIFLGSFLLMLPAATVGNLSYIDILFTSASAVFVTGLNVVDTELAFTVFGKVIILFLIQIGGLGIMTITTYFSFFFRGGTSYKSQLLVKDIINEDKLNEVFSSLKTILVVTLIIEGLGALLIFLFLSNKSMGLANNIFFSIFHSISAFCNAGFSTLSGNMYDARIRFDYPVHLIMSFLIILGGIGFPIIHNLWQYITINLNNYFKRLFRRQKYNYSPWVITVNSHIVLVTTAILLIVGTFSFYIFESDGVLLEHNSVTGKLIASFFGSVTTRTAGFNNVDTFALSIPTTYMFIILMWIGASPASTGGGIKTTTFAVAVMNFSALIKGSKRIEYRGREISQLSVSRAFAQMILAILIIMIVTFILIELEPDKEPMNLLFETVSAYGTVGLSRNITPFLTDTSKLFITATMFIGRISLFTLLVSLTKKSDLSNYKYPTEDLLIN